ncbi:hypothetical protein BQ8420_14545 [Nocardiopsis sp. JB363]|nr:hypothetical protein BQ8420_14545 [Nocardiopsis sp. JB363]
MQRRIGPFEIGDPWPPNVGTAAHEWPAPALAGGHDEH